MVRVRHERPARPGPQPGCQRDDSDAVASPEVGGAPLGPGPGNTAPHVRAVLLCSQGTSQASVEALLQQ